jgi:exodeoxyribonuclease VII small subunit
MKKTLAKEDANNFESSLKKLTCLVEKMETGDLSLDAAMKAFEEGVKLTCEAQEAIAKAEQTIQILVDQNGFPSSKELYGEEGG